MAVLTERRIGICGIGIIGGALVRGLLRRKDVEPERLTGSTRSEDSATRAAERLGIAVGTDNQALARACDIFLLAVKPQQVVEVLDSVADALAPETLVISVAASVPIERMENALGRPQPIVRVMPNTPCRLGEGMSVLSPGTHVGEEQIEWAEAIFSAVGRTAVLDERLMDAVTGLSGSGPAYIYLIIEALAEAGVKLGIPRDTATLLSAQTVRGAAEMVLELGRHPALLKDNVTTPAGCTVDGLLELEEGRLRVALIKAVVTAANRARELVDG